MPRLLCLPLLLLLFIGIYLGRRARSALPLGRRRLLHLVFAYGFQGAGDDAEKLSLTDQLF